MSNINCSASRSINYVYNNSTSYLYKNIAQLRSGPLADFVHNISMDVRSCKNYDLFMLLDFNLRQIHFA